VIAKFEYYYSSLNSVGLRTIPLRTLRIRLEPLEELMQNCFRTLIFAATLISFYYPNCAISANKVVVIPLEADRPRLANIVTVAKSGGDYKDISQAIRSISDASSNKPYIVYIAPGVYDTTESLFLPSYVSLIGSGATSTIINSNFNRQAGFSFRANAAIATGFHNEVANLTLNRVSNNSALGLHTGNTLPDQSITSVRYSNLVINVSAGSEARAIVNDINGFGALLTMQDIKITVIGETVFSAGVQNLGSGGLRELNRVDMVLEGASSILGIINTEGVRLKLNNSNIDITTASTSQITGIRNQSGSNLEMRNTIINVGGSQTTSVGITNRSSSFSLIENSLVRSFLSREGQTSYGVENSDDTARATIRNSTISGDTRPLVARNGSGFRETYVSFSTLGGDGETSGSPVCQFNVDEDNIALTSNCREP
jgi:hypothetical protein